MIKAELAKVAPVLTKETQKLVNLVRDFIDLVVDTGHLQSPQSMRMMLDTIVGRVQRTIDFRPLVDAVNAVSDLARNEPEKTPDEQQPAEAAPAAEA